MSGTPALSRPKELFTQIQALNGRLFPNFYTFAKRYCDATQTRFGLDCNGSSNLKELHVILSSFMIRRIKSQVPLPSFLCIVVSFIIPFSCLTLSQVLTQLPPKRRSRVYISVAEKDIKVLQKARQRLREGTTKLGKGDLVCFVNIIHQYYSVTHLILIFYSLAR